MRSSDRLGWQQRLFWKVVSFMNQICSKEPRIITVAAILIIIPSNHLSFRIWLYIIDLSLLVACTMNNCISLISFPRSLINFSTFNLRVNTFICNPLIPTKMMLNVSTWYHPIITNIVENGISAEQVLKHSRKTENRWIMEPRGCHSQGGDYAALT